MSFTKLKQIFPHLNEKRLTFDDFYKSELAGLPIIEIKLKKRGYHSFDLAEKWDCVFLRKGLDELKYLETFWHEVGHVFGLSEFECNAFRLIAIIPAPYLENYDWLDENSSKYAFKLWRERLRLKFLYQI